MLDSPIFQVIVGMIFVFSLLSILVTQINSVVASAFKLRASHLRDGINDLVQDPILRAKILSHPLVGLLKDQLILPDQKITQDEAEAITHKQVNNIQWISPESFVNVVMSIIQVDSDQELFSTLYHVIDAMPSGEHRRRLRLIVNRIISHGEGLEELRTYVSNIEETVYRQALQEAINEIDDEIGRLGLEPTKIISLKAGVRTIKNPYFRSVMETILATSETLEEAETQIKRWFDEGMGRASDLYKRTMLRLSLFIGIMIAIILNVDSLHLARTLWEDPALRASVVAAAQATNIDQLEQMLEEANVRAQSTPQPIDPNATDEIIPPPTDENLTDIVGEVTEGIDEARNTLVTLLELRLPIGWRYMPLGEYDENSTLSRLAFSDTGNIWNLIPGNSPFWASLIFSKLVGLIATMIAIAQGAPFWFNLLKRMTGQNP